MSNMHSQDYLIKFKQGLAAAINALATRNSAVTGEPHYTTDGKKLYVFDSTVNRRVHGLDMTVTMDGEVMVNDGEVVWMGEY